MLKPELSSASSLIKKTLLQLLAIGLIMGLLLTFVMGFIEHYQQKRQNLQQLSQLLASSASVVDGGALVARQVRLLLRDDPTIHSIVFYATEQPVENLNQAQIEQTRWDWYHALFASSVSFNQAVTSQSLQDDPNVIPKPVSNRNALIGYINITLDIEVLRWQWLKANVWWWLAISTLGLASMLFCARKLNWLNHDLSELSQAWQMDDNKPEVDQVPAVQQRFEFTELMQIQQAFARLFERLKTAQDHIVSLADFEAKLQSKDLSLEVQRHNFQSMITHELKTSLNAISGGLQLFNPQSLSDEQQDILEVIRKGSQHLNGTLEQIIQLNKIEKGQIGLTLTDFNPLQLLADLLDKFEPKVRQKNLSLVSRIYHIDYNLEGDVGKITQVLSSLIDNAIKFSHFGEIVIESQLTHFNESIRWQIKIIDQGIGIEKKYLEDIFTPFFQVDPSVTREYEGVGIGLPVIKQIVQLMGGSIEVKSELGQGSAFTVMIPLKDSLTGNQQRVLAGTSILYYHREDSAVMIDMLKASGAHVEAYQHAAEILAKLKTSAVDMVMIGEEISIEKAGNLAALIRQEEHQHRVLIVYWFTAHKGFVMQTMSAQLQALGIDFCHKTIRDVKQLQNLITNWRG